MDIKAAIFDCDGTILDSMPMWFDVFPRWLASRGAPDPHGLSDRYEYMDFEEECFFFHDEFGICESREAALAEVKAQVIEGYQQRVEPFEGVRNFLDALASEGVPMAILSSTSEPLVRAALASFGLEGYFSHVCYTGDVGYDKQHAEAYHTVRKLLGTSIDQTWVFEDAPFGVATARGAGYPTVCLLNDHDGRDESFMREHSDILAHGWPELSLSLLRDYERPAQGIANADPLQVFVVGGSPVPSTPAFVAGLAAESGYVIAADRGAEVLRAAGIAPDAFCGDDDTASPETAAWAREAATTTITYPADKYATDLALALDCARHEAARQGRSLALTATCVSGGRPDHALGVLGNLLTAKDASPRIVEDVPTAFECRLLSPEGTATWKLGAEAVGRTVSVIALSEGCVVSEAGLAWELDHSPLPLLADRGISNRVTSENATITAHSGTLAAFRF